MTINLPKPYTVASNIEIPGTNQETTRTRNLWNNIGKPIAKFKGYCFAFGISSSLFGMVIDPTPHPDLNITRYGYDITEKNGFNSGVRIYQFENMNRHYEFKNSEGKVVKTIHNAVDADHLNQQAWETEYTMERKYDQTEKVALWNGFVENTLDNTILLETGLLSALKYVGNEVILPVCREIKDLTIGIKDLAEGAIESNTSKVTDIKTNFEQNESQFNTQAIKLVRS